MSSPDSSTRDPATGLTSMASPWPEVDDAPGARGGPEHGEVHRAQRRLQDLLTGAVLPPELSAEVAVRLREIADLAAAHQGQERDRYDGFRDDLPGRGHPFLPPYTVLESRPRWLRGTVTFGRFHLGGGAAVHGGTHPLLFDDVLGRAVNHLEPGIARTAYLKVNYRRVTPIGVELVFEASLDRVEGRKRYATARLLGPDGAVLADAEALFVELLPGQP